MSLSDLNIIPVCALVIALLGYITNLARKELAAAADRREQDDDRRRFLEFRANKRNEARDCLKQRTGNLANDIDLEKKAVHLELEGLYGRTLEYGDLPIERPPWVEQGTSVCRVLRTAYRARKCGDMRVANCTHRAVHNIVARPVIRRRLVLTERKYSCRLSRAETRALKDILDALDGVPRKPTRTPSAVLVAIFRSMWGMLDGMVDGLSKAMSLVCDWVFGNVLGMIREMAKRTRSEMPETTPAPAASTISQGVPSTPAATLVEPASTAVEDIDYAELGKYFQD